MTTRRAFLAGLGSIIAAPAIVRASSLMPIKVQTPLIDAALTDFSIAYFQETHRYLLVHPWPTPTTLIVGERVYEELRRMIAEGDTAGLPRFRYRLNRPLPVFE